VHPKWVYSKMPRLLDALMLAIGASWLPKFPSSNSTISHFHSPLCVAFHRSSLCHIPPLYCSCIIHVISSCNFYHTVPYACPSTIKIRDAFSLETRSVSEGSETRSVSEGSETHSVSEGSETCSVSKVEARQSINNTHILTRDQECCS